VASDAVPLVGTASGGGATAAGGDAE